MSVRIFVLYGKDWTEARQMENNENKSILQYFRAKEWIDGNEKSAQSIHFRILFPLTAVIQSIGFIFLNYCSRLIFNCMLVIWSVSGSFLSAFQILSIQLICPPTKMTDRQTQMEIRQLHNIFVEFNLMLNFSLLNSFIYWLEKFSS